MADDKKKDDKKGAPAPSGGIGEYAPLLWLIGGAIFISLFLTNWNGTFFDLGASTVEDPETGEIVARKESLRFPTGRITPGVEVVTRDEVFVRAVPAGDILGKQKAYKTARIESGPETAFGERWWMLDFDKAPDGFVSESNITSYVGLYKTIFILPILWQYLKFVLWIISVILFVLFLYAKFGLIAAQEEAAKRLLGEPEKVPHIDMSKEESIGQMAEAEKKSNTRWMHVLQLLESHSQGDWRQAVIEADIILEEMLDKMGYEGVTIGDKLKNVESSDFLTLNQAWEAHKIRNKIAHMGSEFKITQGEAKKVIGLYQEVFEEFYFI